MKLKLKNKKKEKRQRFNLPTEFTEPKPNIEDYILWFFGGPGIGKTSLSQQFEDPLHWMFEAGHKALRLKPIFPRRWSHVEGFADTAEADDDFKTNVIDTVEAMYELAWAAAKKKMGWDHPSDEPYGKGWDSVKAPFIKALNRIMFMPHKGTVLISHAKSGERKTYDGDVFEDIHPNLSGAALEAVAGAVDVIGYYHIRKGQHVLQIRPSDDVMAKCRLEERFLYTDGSPIKFIPMGESKVEAYENFVAAFNNELDRPEERTVKKAKLKMKRKKK